MDIQKIATFGTAATVVGTGAFVGGNTLIDQKTVVSELKFQLKQLKPDDSIQDWGCPIMNTVFEHCIECSGLFKSKSICNSCIIRKSLIGEKNEPEKH